MQVPKDQDIRAEGATLGVGDGALLTECFHDRLSLPQLVPRHAREQVMLNLVIEPAIPEVGNRIPNDVAARQNLPAEEIDVVLTG